MNQTIRRLSAATLATTFFLAWAIPAPAQQDGPLSEAGRAVKRGFQAAGQAVSGGFQKTRTTVHNMEVVSRVYSRLHWDKTLAGSTVEIEVQAGGVAILTGVVPSEDAKTKALSLTSETVGVNQVVDQLTVAATTKPAPVVTPSVTAPAPTPAPSSLTILVTPPSAVVPDPTPAKPAEADTPI